jgi:hypothetical protein
MRAGFVRIPENIGLSDAAEFYKSLPPASPAERLAIAEGALEYELKTTYSGIGPHGLELFKTRRMREASTRLFPSQARADLAENATCPA